MQPLLIWLGLVAVAVCACRACSLCCRWPAAVNRGLRRLSRGYRWPIL